ncbi:DUF3267 domain-containing protein [Enterococcus sp. HY326]|uniref:DUF3267 domain-containing protein n=1 Tax=Enterococcus sp. HY326 TaxID=2971265 RepID=UPI002240CC02|nr:DUF3267 domain-containing protein [Enterococcus sp. HY326]
MKLVKSINIMENKRAVVWLNVAAIALGIVFFGIFAILAELLQPTAGSEETSLIGLFLFVVVSFVVIIVHELIHGFFFKVFNLEGKVKFGFKNGMAYATSPNSYYTKTQFLIIILAPFVIISCCLVLLYSLNILSASFFAIVAAVHAGGCSGDFYFALLLLKSPQNTLVEDTEVGINFYQKENV